MAKPKRMSDMFASPAEKENTILSATPPFSSEGPTLPLDDQTSESKTAQKEIPKPGTESTQPVKSDQPQTPTVHPSLFTPWTLLPDELLALLVSQNRLRETQNIIPIVFTKNQNVKSGINKLKTYFGACRESINQIPLPEALRQDDALIAVSAQGEGTSKLVSIVEMAKRIVKPAAGEEKGWETWYTYVSLASLEVRRKRREVPRKEGGDTANARAEPQDGGEAEPMCIDGGMEEEIARGADLARVPVLTVWMTRKSIPAFKRAFDEQGFKVRKVAAQES